MFVLCDEIVSLLLTGNGSVILRCYVQHCLMFVWWNSQFIVNRKWQYDSEMLRLALLNVCFVWWNGQFIVNRKWQRDSEMLRPALLNVLWHNLLLFKVAMTYGYILLFMMIGKNTVSCEFKLSLIFYKTGVKLVTSDVNKRKWKTTW